MHALIRELTRSRSSARPLRGRRPALPDLTSIRSLQLAPRDRFSRWDSAIATREAGKRVTLDTLDVHTVLAPVTDAVDRAIDMLTMTMQREATPT